MKLHLPSALRRALLATFAVAVSSFAEASTLHSQVTLQTYTDFGQNMGRYVTASRTNALLAYIRGKEGITITYTDGREAYRLEEAGMKTGFDVVVVARNRAASTDYAHLHQSLVKALSKLGLFAA